MTATITTHAMSTTSGVDDEAADLVVELAGLPETDPDRAALRERVIQAWLPLARQLAYRFHGRGEPLDDLVQTATVGLIKAVDRYDPGHGTEFVTYAVPTITGELKRHFRDRTWDVRVPRRLQELKLDLAEATETLAQRLGGAPSVTELAGYLDRSEQDVRDGLEGARAYRSVSLQTLVGDAGDGRELGDIFGAEDPQLSLAELRVSLGPALHVLPPRERQIVVLRFFGNLTQTQIAHRVGISQMHVSRLLARSLEMLRGALTLPETA